MRMRAHAKSAARAAAHMEPAGTLGDSQPSNKRAASPWFVCSLT
jgi:hypothetical protein